MKSMIGKQLNVCDFDHDTTDEVRSLPIGGDGNIIVCYRHYVREMEFRRERNNNSGASFSLPSWDSLKIYG